MFLIVFVTLMISIIGLFAQILGLQTAQIYNAQVGLMQTMSAWHGTAVTLVLSKPPSNLSAAGCQVTSTTIASPAVCLYGGNPLVVTSAVLPQGYSTTAFSFFSVAFTSGAPAVTYVVTFAHDTDASGNLILPNSSAIGYTVGYTINDLMRQFTRAAPTNVVYGSVKVAGTLTAYANGGTPTSLSYSIPATIPAGSFAMISAAQ